MAAHKNKARLTSRQKEIIQILTRFTSSRPVTVAMISETMGVSSRTILRELPHVEQWMQQNDFHFVRKPGVGLILEESVENKKLILELLEIECVRKSYTKDERRRRILGDLLYAQEPLKSYYFVSELGVSEGTLSSDLEEIERWLRTYGIRLIRRPGVGILLEGQESSYRQAIANLVYESMDENRIMQVLHGEMQNEINNVAIQNKVFGMLDRAITSQVEEILQESAKRLGLRYTDSAFVGLIIHISLALTRIANNEKIEMEREKLQQLMLLPEFSVAEEISDRLKETFRVPVPLSEVGYITMHLSSSSIWPADDRRARGIESMRLRQLVRQMIEQVEQELGVILHDSDRLFEDLVNHMSPALSRLSLGIALENPQAVSLEEEYPEILQATRNACKVLCDELSLPVVPDSEIAYLAMHFGAAMERKMQSMKRVSAVVVCPTGLGTCRILEAGLEKDFPNIAVRGAISVFRIDTERLRRQGIDLIISTVELTVDYPWICVRPVLQAQDKRRIESMLAILQQKSDPQARELQQQRIKQDDIALITQLGAELMDLTGHLAFDTLKAVRSREELIAAAGRLFAQDARAAADIEGGLYERDRLADTYLKQMNILLLHCKTNMVQHARFGYLRLEPPLYEDGKIIRGATVMLAPDSDTDGNSVHQQLIGAISARLIEDKTLLNLLYNGDWEQSRSAIERGLNVYYKNILKKRLGVEGK